METDLEFEPLDPDFEQACDVARGTNGTLYIDTNSPDGHVVARFSLHPRLVIALRDWITAHYETNEPAPGPR